MKTSQSWTVMLGSLAILAAAIALTAAEPKSTIDTTITIKDMQCPMCAKKVTQKLKAVSNVADVKTDVETSLATVSPQKGKSASGRALWEAVESAGYKPIKLQGPGGTFTSKPKPKS